METDSAWVVILATSLVTLAAALLLRRLISRPGGLASALLLLSPLVLPLLAAAFYQHAVLPEIAVLRPVGSALLERPNEILHLLWLSDGQSQVLTPYAFSGGAGRWLLVVGLAVSSVMLVRRLVGTVLVRRMIARARLVEDPAEPFHRIVTSLAEAVGLRTVPQVLELPSAVPGAFVVGGRRARLLVSSRLVSELDEEELRCIVAHELAHLEAHDVRVMLLAGLLRDVVAWNPLAHVAFRRLAGDRELEADRRAASLTGEPLALASGLLKVCALMKGRRGAATRAALALVRPRGRLRERVAKLIAMSDRGSAALPASRLPYVTAAAMVALLGLHAGARVAAPNPAAVTFVWGAPETGDVDIWVPPQAKPDLERKRLQTSGTDKARRTALDVKDPMGYLKVAGGMSVKEKHVRKWIGTMMKVAKKTGVPASTLQWEVEPGWGAEPLFSSRPRMGPVGIYRMELRGEVATVAQ